MTYAPVASAVGEPVVEVDEALAGLGAGPSTTKA